MTTVHERVLPFTPSARLEGTADGSTAGSGDPVALGRRLRHHRREAGLTLAALAGRTGLSASALSLIENGRREARVSTLTALAQALGV